VWMGQGWLDTCDNVSSSVPLHMHIDAIGAAGPASACCPGAAGVLLQWTGIPISKLVSSERERLLGLGDELHKRIVGQEAAVNAVATAHPAQQVHARAAAPPRPSLPVSLRCFLWLDLP